MRFILSFSFSLALTVPQSHGVSGPALTLQQIETVALENNPEILATRSRVATVEARVAGAAGINDPSVMYRGWGVPMLQPWNLNQAQHMFMFSQEIPGPGKRGLRYLVAAEGADAAQLEIDAKKREIAARVRYAFYQLLRTYEEVRLHEQQVALAQQGIAAARIKYTVGRVPQQDVLKAQIALTRLADHLITLRRDADMARAALNTLMGREPSMALEVTGEHVLIDRLPSFEGLQQIALQNRPELLGLQAAIKQAETKTRLAEKAFTPDFSVAAGYMVMPPGSHSRNAYMGEVSMTLPWLNRGKHEAEIREAQSEVAALRAGYRNQISQISREIREALIKAEAAVQLVELYRDTLRPQAESTLRATSAAYQTDQTDFLNLLDSERIYLNAKLAHIEKLTDGLKSHADLVRATGLDLNEDI